MPRKEPVPDLVPIGTPLAPPPDDLDVMMAVEAPLEELKPFTDLPGLDSADARMVQEFVATDRLTDKKWAQRGVGHVAPPQRTLYSINGESRSVMHSDVPMLVDMSLPAATRLYIRCPKCMHMPNQGFHKMAGTNQCPGKPKKLWSACPICRNHGREHRVFEDEAFESKPRDLETDENYVAPRLPSDVEREDRLRAKLDLHMVTFHSGEAHQLFGLRRKSLNNGQSFMASASNALGEDE